MEYTKDSIVKSICGIDSNITIEKLINSMPKNGIAFDNDDIETILEEVNGGYYEDDGYEFTFDGEEFSVNIQEDYGVTEFLENCFGEKYLMMISTRFSYQNFENDGKGGIWQHPGMSINLVESDIEGDGEGIFHIITKDHYEDEIDKINEDNFLTDTEKKQIDICEKNYEKYERYYDAKYCFYFIKKSEFNIDKWWLGWTPPQY